MAGEEVVRQQWNSKIEFMLSVLGYSVGLGNIWRFPYLAYENGGGSFLIPYLFVSCVIGFPIMYLELSLGQYARAGPAVLHGRIRPLFQGLGWTMVSMALMVSIYYHMLMAWVIMYLFSLIIGRSSWWTSCMQSYNTEYCFSPEDDEYCKKSFPTSGFYFNRSCHDVLDGKMWGYRENFYKEHNRVSPAEEFYKYYVLEKSNSMEDLGGLNWKIVACYAAAWLITALSLQKGVKLMGKLAYVTATVPYCIVLILFIRSITLEGAGDGLRGFIFNSSFTDIFTQPKIIRNACLQICYSLSVGSGGIHSMASYLPTDHNTYLTAGVIVFADGLMSVLGSLSVFSVLGFMSKQLDRNLYEVVEQGTSLAFITYPTATSRMHFPWLWSFLFFMMLWLLAVSTQFGFVESICTAIYDQFPATRRHRSLLTYFCAFFLWCCGLILCTRAGVYYFQIFDSYATVALMIVLLLELVLVCHIYGVQNYMKDLQSIFGKPRTVWGKWFGPTGYYPAFSWTVICPIVCVVMFGVSIWTLANPENRLRDGDKPYPAWSIALGWVISCIPLLLLPIFVIYNLRKFHQKGLSWRELLRLQPKWPSYSRHQENGTGGAANSDRIGVVDPSFINQKP